MSLTFLQRLQISTEDRKEWYRAMAKITADGLPLFDALERMGREFTKHRNPLAPLVETVLLRLRGAGTSRSGPKRRTLGTELTGLVPYDEALLIQSGDNSGQVAAGLANAVTLVETKGKMMTTVLGSMMKPFGYLLAMIGLLLFFSIKLLPSFEKVRPRDQWPASAQLLGTVADNVPLIVGGVIALLVFAVVLLTVVVPRWDSETREWCDRHAPPFNLIAGLYGASFLTSLSGYIGAGTSFVEGVDGIKATATPYMKMQCSKLMMLMKAGKRPEEALCRLSIVPARYHWIISVYAMSGDSAAAYKTISEEMMRSVLKFIDRLFGLVLGNFMLLTIGGVLFWIYSSMFGIATASSTSM